MTNTCNTTCSNTKSKNPSQLGFYVAMLCVVALGGGAYLYFDSTVFSPVDAQEQTVLNNPGVGHPPRGKRPSAAKPAATNATTTQRSDVQEN